MSTLQESQRIDRKTSVLWSSPGHPKAEEAEVRTVLLNLEKHESAAGVHLPALSRLGCVRCQGREECTLGKLSVTHLPLLLGWQLLLCCRCN